MSPGEILPLRQQEQRSDMFHVEEDAALLRAITLPDRTISPDFVDELNRHIETGSQTMNVHTSTGTRRAIDKARLSAVSMAGFGQPEHPLRDAFLDTRTNDRYINPRLFGALKSLAAIGDPVEIIRGAPRVWRLSGKTISQRVTYLGRVAAVLKWQGEQKAPDEPPPPDELVRELVGEYPGILLYSVAKLSALARIAAEFGEEKHRALPKKVVARHITARRVEGHIAGIVHHKDYELGLTSSGNSPGKIQHAKKLQAQIYEGLSDPTYVERVGRPVLWAYFRAHPPSAEARLLFPAVRDFVPKGDCQGSSLFTIGTGAVPRVVTGKEEWLPEVNIPLYPRLPQVQASREQALATLNWHIALGSYSLLDVPAEEGVSRAYELIRGHRYAFFDLLGWTDPEHVLHDRVEAYARKHHSLIAPLQVVSVINALSSRGVRPITPVLESFFGVLELSPELLHKKMDVYEAEGENVNKRLQRGATSLRMSVPALAARLAIEVQKRKERVAKGFKPKELSPGTRKRRLKQKD